MTRLQPLKTIVLTALLLLPAFSSAVAQENESATMTISRFLTCQAVENREPVGVTNTFTATTGIAYAYLEAKGISSDVEVNIVWYHGNNEVAKVPLSIRQGNRWRTYSSKKLGGRTGDWRVEIQDNTASTLASLDFTVE